DTADDVKSQGDSITLLEERSKRYVGSQLIIGGTPTIKDVSKTEHRARSSDMRVLPIACHDCGEKHVLDWDNVKWDQIGKDEEPHEIYGKAAPETAYYACPECGSVWNDYQRQEDIRQIVIKAMDS